jgi:hypothetical protein
MLESLIESFPSEVFHLANSQKAQTIKESKNQRMMTSRFTSCNEWTNYYEQKECSEHSQEREER